MLWNSHFMSPYDEYLDFPSTFVPFFDVAKVADSDERSWGDTPSCAPTPLLSATVYSNTVAEFEVFPSLLAQDTVKGFPC